ncbi:hypothetical protein FOZ63_008058, partial [Perkinsus olseni]
RWKIVACPSFYTFQANPWLRLFAGAQRILASKKYRDTWFYEFSTMDGRILFNSPERDTVVVRSLRKDWMAITAVNPSFIPGWPYHCCSPHYSLCGSGPLFCDCRGCIDYQEV